jgi:hypothetical protein
MVRFSNQYSSFSASGSHIGGLIIVILLLGKMPWENAFLQLPCLRVQHFSTVVLVIKHMKSGQGWARTFEILSKCNLHDFLRQRSKI